MLQGEGAVSGEKTVCLTMGAGDTQVIGESNNDDMLI